MDANVWFAAACSKTGASFLIMQLAKAGLVQAFVNQHVLDEAERTLLQKIREDFASLLLSAGSLWSLDIVAILDFVGRKLGLAVNILAGFGRNAQTLYILARNFSCQL